MCGIYGIVSLGPGRTPDPEFLDRMGAVTVHRGPDDHGKYSSNGIAMGMRRLSIIDVAGGHQPISNEDETVWVVCNGEIYNFRELRRELEALGHRFRSSSDTEVIVHAYEEYGEKVVDHLGGMFGFALWDEKNRRLLLARDRLGIKPLYYTQRDGQLIFASETKAILTVPGVQAELDPQACYQYLALGYPPAPHSMFRGIRKLPTGSAMTVEGGRSHIWRYWSLPPELDEARSEQEWTEAVLQVTERAVASQMVSDVPLGAFLSGGLDSSAVVAMMARNSGRPVKTYAIGFDTKGSEGQYYNELPFARLVAERFGTEHHEIMVRPNVVELLPKLIWQMDEPVADSAFITTFLVAEFARKDVTVILSGVGGDELFGGYRRYLGEYYGRYYRWIPHGVRRRVLQPLARRLPADRHSPLMNLSRLARAFVLTGDSSLEERYRSYVGVFSEQALMRVLRDRPEVQRLALDDAFGASADGDALRTLFEVDLATQLPDDLLLLTDKMTMATSLECRVPLLDHELVELAARMPSRFKIRGRELKYVLKKSLTGLLPREIVHRQKRGFGAPLGAWIKNELAPLTRSLLSRESVERRGLLNPDVVSETLDLHDAAKEDHTDHLQALMNLELWCRLYLDHVTPEDLSAELSAGLRS